MAILKLSLDSKNEEEVFAQKVDLKSDEHAAHQNLPLNDQLHP